MEEQARLFVHLASDEMHGLVDGPFEEAKQLLAAHPDLARADLHCALVLGDAEAVGRQLASERDWARRKGGPRDCEPLFYVTHSKFHRESPERAAGLLATA